MAKYWGGKYRIGKDLSEVMLAEIAKKSSQNYALYWEPFVGMGGVMRHMAAPLSKQGLAVYATDLNPALIAMWKYIKQGKDFKQALELQHQDIEKLRETKAQCSALHGFVGHSCGYFGVYFSGRFQMPEYRKLLLRAHKKIESVRLVMTIPLYENVNFFDMAKATVPKNAIIYLDPPYKMDARAFKTTAWAIQGSFSNEDFWQIATQWSEPKLNNLVFVSETHAPQGWKCIWRKTSVNSTPGTHVPFERVEKLFTYVN